MFPSNITGFANTITSYLPSCSTIDYSGYTSKAWSELTSASTGWTGGVIVGAAIAGSVAYGLSRATTREEICPGTSYCDQFTKWTIIKGLDTVSYLTSGAANHLRREEGGPQSSSAADYHSTGWYDQDHDITLRGEYGQNTPGHFPMDD